MAGLYIGYALKHLEKEVYVFFKMVFLESVNTSRGARRRVTIEVYEEQEEQ